MASSLAVCHAETVSSASLYLAYLMKDEPVPMVEGNGVISEDKMTFLEAFNVSAEDVNEISVTILDMSVHVQFISHARFTRTAHTRFTLLRLRVRLNNCPTLFFLSDGLAFSSAPLLFYLTAFRPTPLTHTSHTLLPLFLLYPQNPLTAYTSSQMIGTRWSAKTNL